MKNNEQKPETADISRLQQENRRLNDENQQLRQQNRTDRVKFSSLNSFWISFDFQGSTPPRSTTTATVNQRKICFRKNFRLWFFVENIVFFSAKGRREHEIMTRDELLFELERADEQIKRLNELLEGKYLFNLNVSFIDERNALLY